MAGKIIFGSDGSCIHQFGDMDVKYSDRGRQTTMHQFGDSAAFGSDHSSTHRFGDMMIQNRHGQNRTVQKFGRMWSDTDGRTYQRSGDMLICSDGRMWHNVESDSDAERVIRMDF